MITRIETRNGKYGKGITAKHDFKIYDNAFEYSIDNFVGIINYDQYPNNRSKAPYDKIYWMNEFMVTLDGINDRKTLYFDDVESALITMYEARPYYAGVCYQKRRLSNGHYDYSVVEYTNGTIKVKEAE